MPAPDYDKVRAPEFPVGLEWLNTPHPLRLQDLRGKFVLLDFWTYCCINCLHVIPDLKRLEETYANELVVIGVHSAKFANEGETENIRNAVLRYGVEHPVVNDSQFAVWQQYAVRAWPTLYLIDPDGYIVGRISGEGVFEPFDKVLRELIPAFEAAGKLNREPFHLQPERKPEHMLSFPGKVTADDASRRLFISDTGHHRLLVTDFEGRVLHQIGRGDAGLADGDFASAAFRAPQGTCFDAASEVLFVADTENHALRRVDVRNRRVSTIAGNGEQAGWGARQADGPASPLNSPWDVALVDGSLYVAMAGPHQLWRFDPNTGMGEVYAGNGRENIVDAPRLDAQLAQPSGIDSDGERLYFMDSETSSLRQVGFGDGARVETLIGEGLFEFGDVDGRRPLARLQHPLGVSVSGHRVYVADTYNHKIKYYDREARAVVSFLGAGVRGLQDGLSHMARFDEPGGLAVAGPLVFVADTNNHQIRVADVETGYVRTLPIATPLEEAPSNVPITYEPQQVKPGDGLFSVEIHLPDGYKPNDVNTGWVRITSSDPDIARPQADGPVPVGYPTAIPITFSNGETEVGLEGAVYFCDEQSGQCLIEPISLRFPLVVQSDASGHVVGVPIHLA